MGQILQRIATAQSRNQTRRHHLLSAPIVSQQAQQIEKRTKTTICRIRHANSSVTCKLISSKSAAPRKRGRPRRRASPPSADYASLSGDCSDIRSSRVPHNAIERKYRQGLNATLESLRQAVPTLPQRRQDGKIGAPRLSKSMIIAGAVEYIEILESEKKLALMETVTEREQRMQSRN